MSEDLTWMGIEMDAAVFGLCQRQTILGRKVAESIVEHLLQLHPTLQPAFLHWWDTGEILDIGPFSGYTANDLITGTKGTRRLAPSGMFLILDTLVRDPKTAIEQLHSRVCGFRPHAPTTEMYDEFIAECDTRRRAAENALERLRADGAAIDSEAASAIDCFAADEIAFADLESRLTALHRPESETGNKAQDGRERILALIRQEAKRLGVMLWQNPYRNPRDSISEVRPSSEPRPRPPRRNKFV
jgi:hypothetical protein